MENLLPRVPIFPWLRFGLTYIIILPFLIRFGAGAAVLLLLCRNVIALVYGGQMFTSFMLSSLSGIVSLGAAGQLALILYRKNITGLLGISVLLACCFNLVQLVLANLFFIRHGSFYFQLGPLLLWSLITGSLVAFLIMKNNNSLQLIFSSTTGGDFSPILPSSVPHGESARNVQEGGAGGHTLKLLGIGILFATLFFISSSTAQLVLLALFLVIIRFKRLKLLFYAWPFYFYLAWLHLFRTEGVYVFRDWITREGLEHFLYYAVRMTNVILCGQWLAQNLFIPWKFLKNNVYARGMAIALPMLPALFGISISLGKVFSVN
jgi:uncharacterized membrane protein